METAQTPISMKNLKEKKTSKIFLFLVLILVATAVAIAVNVVYDNFRPQEVVKAETITLDEVVIAYAPETKSIIFLDRKTGQVEFTLSDSVSLAIFALKSGEITADYNSKVTTTTKK